MKVVKSSIRANVEVAILVTLTEEEVRALEAVFSYGAEAFLKGCYKCLGKHYIAPYEGGIITLHDTVRKELIPVIRQIDVIRKGLPE